MCTFRSTKVLWISLLVLGLYASLAWAEQSASLSGHVYDSKDGSGIVGVDIIVTGSDGKAQATKISGTGGVYEVDGLTPGAPITVVFKKLGYSPYPKSDPINLTGVQNQHDVFLFRDTDDLAYWFQLSQRVASKIQVRSGNANTQSQRLAQEWDKVDAARLPVAAKVRAAQAFSQVIPSGYKVPAGVRTYASVDLEQLHAAQSQISRAVLENGKIDPQRYRLPLAVSADLVAEEISKQKLTDSQTKELLNNIRDASYAAQINAKLKL